MVKCGAGKCLNAFLNSNYCVTLQPQKLCDIVKFYACVGDMGMIYRL